MNDNDLEKTLSAAFDMREKDGWQADFKRKENPDFYESMATIGG